MTFISPVHIINFYNITLIDENFQIFIELMYIIIESVDSISRDGPDTPIYIIHYKKRNNSEQEKFKRF